jgi:sirohydrochlorin ferrochelatase
VNPLINLSCPSGYILVFHGSSDPRSRLAAEALTRRFRDCVAATQPAILVANPSSILTKSDSPLAKPDDLEQPLVYSAYLECHALPLHQQIEQIAQQFRARNPLKRISLRLLPVFLLSGVHLREDIPSEVAQAQQRLEGKVTLDVTAHLGSHPRLQRLLNERMSSLPMEAWILLAHGSRRLDANQPIAAIADRLGAAVAYWSVPPNLESRLQDCVNSGYKHIGILPFFLFKGGITDAIAHTLAQFSQHHPALKLILADTLDASPGLANLLLDLAIQD